MPKISNRSRFRDEQTGDEPGPKQNVSSPKYILHGDYVSPYSITTAHTLLEKGLAWEYRHIDILKFKTRTPEHRKLHPFGKVPILDVLNDQGERILRICESRAIARYIAAVYSDHGNPLMPDISDAETMASFEEAASMEVCYFSTTAWKYCGDIIIKPILGIPRVEENALQDIWNELNGALKAMDGILSGRSYLGGQEFTLVDIWTMPWVSQLIDLKGLDIFFAELPHLRNWWKRVSLRPAWKEACGLMDEAMEVMRQNAANGWEL
ncbi:hypothetical protein LB506_004642 [Fusarium annulatum]|nr:hypothetical protein LB506_004642 [Fusarium annulatum]